MTLSTKVYILDQVDPESVFRFCQGLLTQYDDMRRKPEQQRSQGLKNEPGQDLPAWLLCYHNPGGPTLTPEQVIDEDASLSDLCWMTVDFDTAYGYRMANGWGCGDLHAALVGELGEWLKAQGLRWVWQNEFTGEYHSGHAGLEELGAEGAEAGLWFTSTVIPAIVNRLALEQ